MKRLLLFGILFVLAASVVISCQKELSYETDQNLGHGTLYDSNNACQPIVPNGTYYNGVSAFRDTNFVKVIVTVTQTGAYYLSTDSANGLIFKNSGFFSKLGVDTLLLQAYGTPILNTPTDFTLKLDSSVCGFTINVQDSTGTGLGGVDTSVIVGDSSFVDPNPADPNTWHFTDSTSGVTYSGIFNTAQSEGGILQNDTLYIIGEASSPDTLFAMTIKFSNTTITPGIYPLSTANQIGLQASSNATPLFIANDVTAANGSPNGDSYITITDYTNNQLAGSLHAYAVRDDGTLVLIAGSFNCPVQ